MLSHSRSLVQAVVPVDDRTRTRRGTFDDGLVFEGPAGALRVPDPSRRLLERFAVLVGQENPQEVASEPDPVRQRWGLYREIVGAPALHFGRVPDAGARSAAST